MKEFGKKMRKTWQLHLLFLIPAVYLLIFHYGPIYGLQIAFRNYRIQDGILGSEWVGLKWFKEFVGSYNFWTIFKNTIALSLYSFLLFPLPVIFALGLNALRGEKLKRFTQTVSYLPHFISVTVLVGMLSMLLSPVNGIYGNIFRLFGGEGYPKDIRSLASSFRHLYIWSGEWQDIGWSSIIYMASLSAVPMDLHEAARIDGASRLKRIRYVDFPTILPTVGIMLIMRCGSLVSIGFEKAYLMQYSMNLTTSEIISTYIYKVGLARVSNFSMASAVGLFNTAINMVLLITVNYITKRMTRDDVSLF